MAENLNDLQRALDPIYRTRDFATVIKIFSRGGHNLQSVIYDKIFAMEAAGEDSDLCLLDVGCASGEAIEQLTRSLLIATRYMGKNFPIRGIGVDLTIPEEIDSEIIGIGAESFDFGPDLVSDLRVGSAVDLPVENDSVDVLYSSNTLIYVSDVLKAFEEGYRVLKAGGIAYWDINVDDISIFPHFFRILALTPGGSEVFEYVPIDDKAGFVVCKKGLNDSFRGFPFKIFKEILFNDLQKSYVPDVSDIASYYRNAVYAVIGDLVGPGGIEPPFTG